MITRPITRPITSPIARAVTAAYGAWNPRALFRNGEQGVLYDTNDLSTLFQDSAGATPVTAAGQPVGLMLDKRLGAVLGGNAWETAVKTYEAGWSSIQNGAQASNAASGAYVRIPDAGFVTGRMYVVMFECYDYVAGQFGLTIKGTGNLFRSGNGSFTEYVFAASTSNVGIRSNGGLTAKFRNISVRELPGNHAYQYTAASRPMLRDTPRRIDYDAVDDVLNITFPSSLGSACTVARSIPGVGAQILTAQTIGTSYTLNVDSCADVIINRALTPTETANLTRHLNQRSGV